MIKKIASVLAAGAVSVLLVTGSASAATHAKTIAQCSARGRHAHCVAIARTVSHPVKLYVHVRARPSQRIIGAWGVVCFKGSHHRQRIRKFRGEAGPTLTRRITMPYRHPASCGVIGGAALSRTGRIHVWLTVVK